MGRLFPNLVPLYEEQEALRYANYNPSQWKRLSSWERAFHVAHYRMHRIVDLNVNDAVQNNIEREIKQREMSRKHRSR